MTLTGIRAALGFTVERPFCFVIKRIELSLSLDDLVTPNEARDNVICNRGIWSERSIEFWIFPEMRNYVFADRSRIFLHERKHRISHGRPCWNNGALIRDLPVGDLALVISSLLWSE